MLCFRKFPVVKKFMDKRGEYQDFPSKIFCPTVPKISVGEPVCVSQNFWYQKKIMDKRGEGREGVSGFSVKNFMSHSAEKYRRGTL